MTQIVQQHKWEEWTKLIKLTRSEIHPRAQKTQNSQKKNVDNCTWCEAKGTLESDTSQGNIVCTSCGAVHGDVIDDSIQWKSKTDSHAYSGNAIRCAPVDNLLPKLSLSTKIVPIYGSKNSYNEHRIARLNQWQSGDPLERAIKVDFNFIDGLQYKRHVRFPKNILQTTKMLFKEFYVASYDDAKEFGEKRDCLRGSKRKGLIGLCLHYSCKINKLVCTKKHIADLLGTNKAKIRKAKPIFFAKMKHRINNIKDWNKHVSKISGVTEFIKTYQIVLDVPYYIASYSKKFYKYIKKFNILGSKQPQSIAAVSIFIVLSQLNTNITIQDIINKCVISKATIKDLYKRIDPYKNIALIEVFTPHVCEKLEIFNTITVNQMTQIGCAINRIRGNPEDIKLSIAAAIYFVMVVQDIYTSIPLYRILTVCNVTNDNLLILGKKIIYYKHALVKHYIN